jgi:hypothetical protein
VAHSDCRAVTVAVDQVFSGTHLEEQLFIPDDYSNWYCWRASDGEQLVPVIGVVVPVLLHETFIYRLLASSEKGKGNDDEVDMSPPLGITLT